MMGQAPYDSAYRSWTSDSSDVQALRNYIVSLARIGETPTIEQTVEIEQALNDRDSLRNTYAPLMPICYQNFQKKTYNEDRWRFLVSRYTGRIMRPMAAMFLNLMGRRASVRNVGQILGESGIIKCDVAENIIGLNSDCIPEARDVKTDCAYALGQIGQEAAVAIPDLIDEAKNDDRLVRGSCVWALGQMGSASVLAIPDLVYSMINDDRWCIRHNCAEALGNIGQEAADAIPSLVYSMKFEDYWAVRAECARALGKIGPSAALAIPDLVICSKNDIYGVVREACCEAIARIQGGRL